MGEVRALRAYFRGQMSDWLYSLRTAVSLIVILLLCWLNGDTLRNYLENAGMRITALEALFYFFSSGFGNILLSSSLFLVMMAEIPYQRSVQNLLLLRTSKVRWMLAQIFFYMIIVMLTVFTMSLVALGASSGALIFSPEWSDRSVLSDLTGLERIVPEYAISMSPVKANFVAAGLLIAFWFTMCMVLFVCTMCGLPHLGPAIYIIILTMATTILWESLPDFLRSFPTNFATLGAIARNFPGEEIKVAGDALIAMLSFDLIAVFLCGVMVKRRDLSF